MSKKLDKSKSFHRKLVKLVRKHPTPTDLIRDVFEWDACDIIGYFKNCKMTIKDAAGRGQ